MSQTQTVAHTLATGAPTPRSILDYLTTNTPLGLNGQVTIQGETVLAAGVDNGNDGVKVALFGPTGAVVHIRVPTAHRPAKTFQGGARAR
jgi:hypothetical protein